MTDTSRLRQPSDFTDRLVQDKYLGKSTSLAIHGTSVLRYRKNDLTTSSLPLNEAR